MRDNGTETFRNFVKDCTHELQNSVLVDVAEDTDFSQKNILTPEFSSIYDKAFLQKMYNTWKVYENDFSHPVPWVPKYSVTNVTITTNVRNCHYYRMSRISSSLFPTVKLSLKFIPT
jgi:hypothetical protein